jgi:formylglycine-generating enzyme required for sulfatase activity
MPSGGQTIATTEDGAYTLLGANSDEIVRRNAGARYYLPDADEYHKAAYYDPNPGNDRPSESYWPFADQSTTGPGGNFAATDNLADVKVSSGPSHYGTYDQDGNVAEWTDSTVASFNGSVVGRIIASAAEDPSKPGFVGRAAKSYVSVKSEETRNLLETPLIGFRVAKPTASSAPGGVPLVKPVLRRVGHPGNPPDTTVLGPDQRSPGTVNYEYQIGAFEVTNEEYARFLNAVAKDDLFYGLYDTRMQTDPLGGIRRVGVPGNFTFQVVAGREAWPVNFVGVFDAMRFCNWLHNGATAGADTEAGAYRLLGNIPSNSAILVRNPAARYFLPTNDEWHKAAFYEPEPVGKPSASFWSYAIRSDVADSSRMNFGNAFGGLTSVAFSRAASFYGTFGQSGNTSEMVETVSGGKRLVRGGSWNSDETEASSSAFGAGSDGSADIGFRVAASTEVESGNTNPGPPAPPKGTAIQTITFKNLPKNKRVGSFAFKISPKASSGLPVVCESSNTSVALVSNGPRFTYVFVRGAGTATITAKQEGNEVWAEAEPVSRELIVAPRNSSRR